MTEQGRGEQTRRQIVETAIRLFGELGYEKTTMRAIASAAGVSVGNTYYHFASKEALLREFYLQLVREHAAAAEAVLDAGGGFAEQLIGVLDAGLTVWGPYHEFAGRFIGLAAVPRSPVSPFGEESAESREISLDLFTRLVANTPTKMDDGLRSELPELLWLLQLGVVVYWVHDETPGQTRTRKIIAKGAPYLENIVGLSRLKLFRPVITQGLGILKLIR
ncbi:TetR/AcrR family transcriptional regulator [Hamadaea tsunoensis]|uniref:TetR/AcrR family transcriptional regulator n=1 Tax=Hamadaea tsunoensis TaxID=53368 RepID=UPI00054FB052|nr:TetR/AcrR family transcriptional regulator [Hamadaea tsunoensis]